MRQARISEAGWSPLYIYIYIAGGRAAKFARRIYLISGMNGAMVWGTKLGRTVNWQLAKTILIYIYMERNLFLAGRKIKWM